MKRERSSAYPVLDLETAYRVLCQDLSDLGTLELSRDQLAKKLGYQTAQGGLAARKIGGLSHYGLLHRRALDLYGLSTLGRQLQGLSLGDTDFAAAIRSALEHPVLFKAILDRYRESGRIPQELARELAAFGITEQASAEVARIFRESALFAGVIDFAGLIRTGLTAASTPEPLEESGEDQIELLLAGRKGFLKLPQSFNWDDFLALRASFEAQYKLLPTYFRLGSPPGVVVKEDVPEDPPSTLPFRNPKKPRR